MTETVKADDAAKFGMFSNVFETLLFLESSLLKDIQFQAKLDAKKKVLSKCMQLTLC